MEHPHYQKSCIHCYKQSINTIGVSFFLSRVIENTTNNTIRPDDTERILLLSIKQSIEFRDITKVGMSSEKLCGCIFTYQL